MCSAALLCRLVLSDSLPPTPQPANQLLFPEYERNETSSIGRGEPRFRFLSGSAWQDAEDIRRVLEDAFASIPESKRPDLRERFISHNETAHVGALLELGLYSILQPIADHVEFNPEISALTPDLIVRFRDKEIIVEVTTLAPEPASNDSNSVQRVLGQLEQICLRGYFVDAYIKRLVTRDTPTTRLRRWFKTWIEELDREDTHRAEYVWEDESWKIRFVPEKYPEVSNRENQIIDYAWEDLEGWYGAAEDEIFRSRIRSKVLEKSDRYGSLDGILVVAVASRGIQGYMSSTPVQGMLFDDDWTKPRISAVLYKPVSNPWELYGYDREWALVHNPYAENPLELGLFTFAREYVRQDCEWTHLAPTTNVRALLGLPPSWTRHVLDDE